MPSATAPPTCPGGRGSSDVAAGYLWPWQRRGADEQHRPGQRSTLRMGTAATTADGQPRSGMVNGGRAGVTERGEQRTGSATERGDEAGLRAYAATALRWPREAAPDESPASPKPSGHRASATPAHLRRPPQRAARPSPTIRERVAQKSAQLSHDLSRQRHETVPTLQRRQIMAPPDRGSYSIVARASPLDPSPKPTDGP